MELRFVKYTNCSIVITSLTKVVGRESLYKGGADKDRNIKNGPIERFVSIFSNQMSL